MLVSTDALVLQLRDYMESSRIVRLATRELGLVSAIAKGARRQRAKSGSPLDLFADGVAHLHVRPTRELQTLAGFDGAAGQAWLATDLERILAASAVAEVALRVLHEEPNVPAYEALVGTLAAIARAPADRVDAEALAGAWRLVAALGFTPALDACTSCDTPLAPDEEPVRFVPVLGGVCCARCLARGGPGRQLPAHVRATLRRWVEGGGQPAELASPEAAELRAHRRLLREFLEAHATGERPLRAWAVWDAGTWAR